VLLHMYKHVQINHTIIYVFVYMHKCTYTMSSFVVRGQKQLGKATWKAIMYYGTCQVQAIVPIFCCQFGKFWLTLLLFGLAQIFWQVHYWVQWPVPGMFCTAMVFKLCRMRTHVAFAHNGPVDFGQWLGPIDPRRAYPLCLVRGR
jgi:hypothetical protein